MVNKKEIKKAEIISSEYKAFFEDIKKRIREANYKAFKAFNNELIQLYWDIGKQIVEKQEQKGWGKSVVETLAGDLQKEFAGSQGYSTSNLWRMKNSHQWCEKLDGLIM